VVFVLLLRRLASIALMLLGISMITFAIVHFIPSDPARLWAGNRATLEQVAQAREQLGLNRPLYTQYFLYLDALLHGDFGISQRTRRPVLLDLITYFPATFELTTFSMIFALLFGLVLGIVSATKKGAKIDHFSRLFCLAGVGMPTFWFGLVLQLVCGSMLGLLPFSGRVDVYVALQHPIVNITGLHLVDSLVTGNFVAFSDCLKHMILPALTLSFACLASIARMIRSSLIDALREDYVRTARSKGLSERTVILKHALRNALSPTVTVAGLTYGILLVGSVFTELVFDWPGIGLYATQSAIAIDIPAIMGVTILYGIIYSVVNLGVDVLYALLDPRIRMR
jgi:peptide/nickel transport system permease protein